MRAHLDIINQDYMRTQRPRLQNYSKPFRMISTRSQFLSFQNSEPELATTKTQPKKLDIEIPKPKVVEVLFRPAKRAQFRAYHRFVHPSLLPRADSYELTDIDLVFYSSFKTRLAPDKRAYFGNQLLEALIIEMERQAGKDVDHFVSFHSTARDWMFALLEARGFPLLHSQPALTEEFCREVFEFWKTRREEAKLPLLRVYWNASKEDNDLRRAFRPRSDPDKRKLRRNKAKPAEEDFRGPLQNFCLEMIEASMLLTRLHERQLLKQDKFTLQANEFRQEMNAAMGESASNPALIKNNQQILRQAENRVGQLKNQLQSYLSRQEPPVQVAESKGMCVQFISTVIAMANVYDIDPETLTCSNKIYIPTKEDQGSEQTAVSKEVHESKVVSESASKKFTFGLRRVEGPFGKFLVPCPELRRERPWARSRNFLSRRMKGICERYVFWEEDDQPENKDSKQLRKSVALNFKKWLSKQ